MAQSSRGPRRAAAAAPRRLAALDSVPPGGPSRRSTGIASLVTHGQVAPLCCDLSDLSRGVSLVGADSDLVAQAWEAARCQREKGGLLRPESVEEADACCTERLAQVDPANRQLSGLGFDPVQKGVVMDVATAP
eukprot:CAMPEP_0182585244 /NCGR_PEP_ID=MMETSP1324-20130603/59883_1 /TAXON_ID=236786 /ORGANISM="Florenciella sp., Strain RCC1587" /LENGTH=133 /DNA_ID=CAMNT_0024802031 /DNA_START=403 /DNA_END=805 /DNA_ORIENTATION=+